MSDRPHMGAPSRPQKHPRRGIRLHDQTPATPPPTSPEAGFPVAFLPHCRSEVERRERLTWPALVDHLTLIQPGKKDGPAWMPADIDPGPRTADRVRSWSVLPLDIEAETRGSGDKPKTVIGPEPPPLGELMDELAASGWCCIGHTTHSHLDPRIRPTDQAHHRYRVVFALSRPLVSTEIKPLGLHLAALLGVSECVDTKCLEPARLLYLPRAPQDRIDRFEARTIAGAPLDVDQLLADAQRFHRATEVAQRSPRPPAGADGPSVIDAFNDAHDIPSLLERHSYIQKGRGRWMHPQSSSGMPGVRLLSDTGKVYSDHGCDPLADGRPHDAFDLYRILDHGGDEKAAVREAARLLGLNRPRPASASASAPPTAPPAPPESRQAGAQPPSEPLRIGSYLWKDGIFYLVRMVTGRGQDATTTEQHIALGNFSALVTEERQRDDGESVENRSALTFYQPRGGRITETQVEIQTDRFATMSWITPTLSHHFVVSAGNSVRDHLRACIQTFSVHFGMTTRRVYTHTGWRVIDGELSYLHAGGAITATGARDDLDVDLAEGLARYRLPPPPAPPESRQALAASLRVLDLAPSQPGIGAVQLARIAAPPLALWLRLDLGVFVVGRTGSLKTELAALAMAHYGEFHARALPGNWESSEGALLLAAHAAKDALFEIDDFNPAGSTHDQAQLARKADRVFRAGANAAGRERLSPDIKLRKGQYPRGMVSASGEDLPPGRSLRARMWILDLEVGAIDVAVLTECQRDASEGRYRQTMAGYLQWLAVHAEELAATLPVRYETLRTRAPETLRNHGRIPSNLAVMRIAIETFLRFAVESGALEHDEARAWNTTLADSLTVQALAQADIQEQSEDATRFMELLRAALATGRAHLLDGDAFRKGIMQPPKVHPSLLGWRGHRSGDDATKEPRYEPLGEAIGFAWGNGEVYVGPDAAYTVVSKIARDQGGGALRSQARLGRALIEKGYIKPGDGKGTTYRHNRSGITPGRVWRLSLAKLVESEGEADEHVSSVVSA